MAEIRSVFTEPSDATTKSNSTGDAVAKPNDFTARPRPQHPIIIVSGEGQIKGAEFTRPLPCIAHVWLSTVASLAEVKKKSSQYRQQQTYIVWINL
jgi:hypothetical protein